MNISGWTLAFQAINFLVLVVLLQRFLYKPVLAMLDRRRAENARVTKEATDAKQAAQVVQADLERQRDGLAAERAQIIESAKAVAEKEREVKLAETAAEAAHLIDQAHARIDRDESAARARIEAEATSVAVELARRFLGSVPPSVVSAALLDGVLTELEAMPKPERERLTGAKSGASEVSIVLPAPLGAVELETAKRRLAASVGGNPTFDFQVDSSLISGVELRFPFAILRRNWRDGLQAAQERLAAA